MEFKQAVVTQNGRALMAKLLAGKSTQFTKIKVSSTIYPDAQLANLTALTNIKQETTAQAYGNNTATVSVVGAIENTGLTTGYYINTVGLYAVDPDKGEILYSVSSASVNGYMPPDTGVSKSGFEFKIYTEVGNATKVDLTVDPAAFATHEDIERLEVYQAWATSENGEISNTFRENLLTDTLPNKSPKLEGFNQISDYTTTEFDADGRVIITGTDSARSPYYFAGTFNANKLLSDDFINKVKGQTLVASADIAFENYNTVPPSNVGISIYYWDADGRSFNPSTKKIKYENERIVVEALIPENVVNVMVAIRAFTNPSLNWLDTKIIFDKLKLEIAESTNNSASIYAPAAEEDPINCYPKYVGFGIKSSDNYQDYRWILNPDWAMANAMYGTSIVAMKDQLADIQSWIQAHS